MNFKRFLSESLPNKELIDRAINTFGKTYNPSEVGYILPDGTWLDFSGRHQMAGDYEWNDILKKWKPKGSRDYRSGRRDIDHRELWGIFGDSDMDGGEMMVAFERGVHAIRAAPSGPGFSTIVFPTDAQFDSIVKMVRGVNRKRRTPGGSCFIDVYNPQTQERLGSNSVDTTEEAIREYLNQFRGQLL